MTAFIVSDLHIGSRRFEPDLFLTFLARLPEGAALLLNGDVVDAVRRPLPASHGRVLDALRREAERRPVVWIAGNHDLWYRLDPPGRLRFASSYEFGRRLYVTHGTEFIPYWRAYRAVVRLVLPLRIRFRGEPLLSGHRVRRVRWLHAWVAGGLRRQAVLFAAARGYEAIACGHVHAPDDRSVRGVRYLNTGTWTERPPYYVRVDEGDITFRAVPEG